MNRRRAPDAPVLASHSSDPGEGSEEEYWWRGHPGEREAVVFKTDRFGQRWVLEMDSSQWVTYRVAAGLLDVSVPTIHTWVENGKITATKKRVPTMYTMKKGKLKDADPKGSRAGVLVISLKEVEQIAEARGIFHHAPLTAQQRRVLAGRTVNLKRAKGGEADANEGRIAGRQRRTSR